MRVVIISVFALFLSLALLVSGSAMLGTLMSLRLNLVGISNGVLGIVLACYSVGFVLGATYGISIIREVGHIRAFAVYAALTCAAALLHPIIENVIGWAILRMVVGYCLAGLMTVTESWINDRATNESRGKLLGFYTINFYIASSLGQFLVGFNDPLNFIAYTVVAILVVVSLVPLALTRGLVPSPPTTTDSLQLSHLIKSAPSGMAGVLVSGMGLGAFIALAPVYASGTGMPVSSISGYMGFSIICAIALQWPAGWLSDKIGRLPVLAGLLTIGACTSLLAALFGGHSTALLFLLSGVLFALVSSVYPVSVALANDQLNSDQLVAACAGLLRTYGLGSMLGPLLGGVLMQLIGPSALFFMIAVSLGMAATAIQFVFRAGDQVPLDQQVDFVASSPVSTSILTEIDPRNEEFEQHHPGEPAEWDIADKMEMLIPNQEDKLIDTTKDD